MKEKEANKFLVMFGIFGYEYTPRWSRKVKIYTKNKKGGKL